MKEISKEIELTMNKHIDSVYEIVKNLDEKTKRSLFNILNESYEYCAIPADFPHSKIITLP